MVVVPGPIPALMPLPAMSSLGAVIDTQRATIQWPHGQSVLKCMWSGHLGLALTEGVETFAERHPEGHLFHRAHEHQQLVADIRQSASQKAEPHSASLLETGHTA
eukprot:6102352-Amphidinium_carterae.1